MRLGDALLRSGKGMPCQGSARSSRHCLPCSRLRSFSCQALRMQKNASRLSWAMQPIKRGRSNTPANDAGLIAQTLQAAGFDVVGARDLDQDSLRRACRDFLEKATSSGPDTVAFIYLSGYGVQLEGENYFVPIDAKIARDADVTAEALRVSDYTRPLAALKLKSRHRRSRHCARESVRQVRSATGRRPRNGRAGARPADRF